jgi:hypothetical protein
LRRFPSVFGQEENSEEFPSIGLGCIKRGSDQRIAASKPKLILPSTFPRFQRADGIQQQQQQQGTKMNRRVVVVVIVSCAVILSVRCFGGLGGELASVRAKKKHNSMTSKSSWYVTRLYMN